MLVVKIWTKNVPFADSRECSELNASSPDLNQGPLDLQSNALPTELSRLDWIRGSKNSIILLSCNPIG